MSNEAKIKVGALWEKTGKSGDTYFSGKFGDASLIVFKNKFKKSENQPDYIVYIQESKRENVRQDFGQQPDAPLFCSTDDIPF